MHLLRWYAFIGYDNPYTVLIDVSQERGAECAFPARKRRFADPATVLNTSHTPTNDQESSINAATEQEIITSSPQPTERELRGHPDEQGAPAGTTSGSPGFGEVNTHTGGVEYYGPGGNYAFIRTLWQFALKHGASSEMPPHPSALRGPIEDPTEEASSDSPISVVNYLHTSTPRNSTDSRNNTSASVTVSLISPIPMFSQFILANINLAVVRYSVFQLSWRASKCGPPKGVYPNLLSHNPRHLSISVKATFHEESRGHHMVPIDTFISHQRRAIIEAFQCIIPLRSGTWRAVE